MSMNEKHSAIGRSALDLKAVLVVRTNISSSNPRIEQKMDELARKYVETACEK
jgi:hypothetical protein